MADWKQDPERIKELRKMQEMIKQVSMVMYFTQFVNPAEPEHVVTPMVDKLEAMIVTSIMMGIEPRIRLASHHPMQKGSNLTGGVWLEDDRLRVVMVMGSPGREEMVSLEKPFGATRYGEVLAMMAFKGQSFQSQYQHAVGDIMASIFDPNTHHYQSEDKTSGVHVQVIDDDLLPSSQQPVPTLVERDVLFESLNDDQKELLNRLSAASKLPLKLYLRWIIIFRRGVSEETMGGQIYSNILSHLNGRNGRNPNDTMTSTYAATEFSAQVMRILPKFVEELEESPAVFKVDPNSESAIAQFGLTKEVIGSGVSAEFATHWLLEIVHLSHDENPGNKAGILQEEMAVDIYKKHRMLGAQGTLVAYMLFGIMSKAVMEADEGLRNKWWERRKKIREEYDRNGQLKK